MLYKKHYKFIRALFALVLVVLACTAFNYKALAEINFFTATIEDKPLNPVANDDEIVIRQNESKSVNIVANDDAIVSKIDPTTIEIVEPAQSGFLEISEDGKITYTPINPDLTQDSFTYVVRDLNGNLSNVATVRVKLDEPLDNAHND